MASFHLRYENLSCGPFHQNQITHRAPCEQNTAPRSLHSWTRVALQFCDYYNLPGTFNDATYIPASAAPTEITQEFTTMMFYHRQNQVLKNERRGAFVPLLLVHQLELSIRTNAMPSVEVPWTPLPSLPKLSPLRSRPPKFVWRLQIESSLIPALKSGCNISVPFICYPLHHFLLPPMLHPTRPL